jgi:hypothetical protein
MNRTVITAFNPETGGQSNAYVQLSTLTDGIVDVTVRFSQDVNLITDPSVTDSTTAISAQGTKAMFCGQTVYHTLRLNPCKTWIRAFAATGGNAFMLINNQ